MSDDNSEVDDKKVIGQEQAPTQSQEDKEKAQAVEDYSKVEENGELSMRVKVYSPFNDYFEGQAFSISAENATGPFDILPKHHNFICMLLPCTIRVATTSGVKEIPVHRALMHVKADKVVVFVDV